MAVDLKSLAEKERGEQQIRLLVCRTCKSIDELPDFDGPEEYDTVLQVAVERHQKPEPHLGLLMKFPLKYWARPDVKTEVMKQISEGSSGLDVFGTNFYDTKSTFHEDAMKCYNLHMRPTTSCGDYKSDKKELKPGTANERKAEGLGEHRGLRSIFVTSAPIRCKYKSKRLTRKDYTNNGRDTSRGNRTYRSTAPGDRSARC